VRVHAAAVTCANRTKEIGVLEYAKAAEILVAMEPSFKSQVVGTLAERLGLNYFLN
jgi:hypothetical protein